MKTISSLTLFLFLFLNAYPGLARAVPKAPEPDRAGKALIAENYGKLPLSFEKNQGQTDEKVGFLSRGGGYTLFLTPDEAVLALSSPSEDEGLGNKRKDALQVSRPEKQKSAKVAVIRMKFSGANTAPVIFGQERLSGTSNYFIGNDPSNWRTRVSKYAKVRYREVYPGIDLVFYGNQRQLEYDFVVSPGSDPSKIRLEFQGAEKISLDEKGNLVLRLKDGEVIQQAPVIYQEVNGRKVDVAGGYLIDNKGRVGCRVASWDRQRPLVIDPVLVYSTYLGGSDHDYGGDIAVDDSGNAFVTGYTQSSDFPTVNALYPDLRGDKDAFIFKLSADGSQAVYSTYLGGSDLDNGGDIAVDDSGNAYVTGYTKSSDFPTVNALYPDYSGGNGDAFIFKLSADGSQAVYSTYLGGSDLDYGNDIAVDGSGNAYVTGYTYSPDFPTVNALYLDLWGADAFIFKLSADGSQAVYSTYLGGSDYDWGKGIAVDGSGNAYVTGYTGSPDFPTVNALYPDLPGLFQAAFIFKLSADGSQAVYSTCLGGSGVDHGGDIAVDGSGNAYVTGYTYSPDFPTVNALYPDLWGADAFIFKLSADGSQAVYSTYLGGSDHDYGGDIAVDDSGNAYVTGYTYSPDFPTVNALYPDLWGADAFIAKINFSDPLGEIHGSKWNDLDGNGVWDDGEPGLGNWKIYLDENANGQWDSGELYDLTDSSGNYSFADLEAGTYVVAEVLQLGWRQTYPSGSPIAALGLGGPTTYGDMLTSEELEQIERMEMNSPPLPPPGIESTILFSIPQSAVMLSAVPTSIWTYGCSATSAGMIFGYYDRTGFSDMYTGPTNGGVAPLTDLGQGIEVTPIPGSCSIIATQNGFDGRTVSGHVDDYWTGAGDPGPDPWEGNWPEHTWEGCTADYMGTNQWKWDFDPWPNGDGIIDCNHDGEAALFSNNNSDPLFDFVPPESLGLPATALCHGLRLFAESRGYTVEENYTQRIDTLYPGGFSFADYMAEINAGRPVMIQVTGHSMVGVGYYEPTQTVYLHDTWDNNVHFMTWGGDYAGMDHRSVTVIHLAGGQTETHTVTLAPGNIINDINFGNNYQTQHDPELTSGNVDPDSGNDTTTFTYTVHYYDQDGDSPSTSYVYIDGSSHIMTLYSGSASDGTYRYQTTLSTGSHNYYFYFTDGSGGSDTLPSSGTYSGPPVISLCEHGHTSLDHNWTPISLNNTYQNPVVIIGPPTYHGTDPGVVRLQNVTGSSFDIRFQEWLYKDGYHAQEDIPYLVSEFGRLEMPDGSIWEAGTFSLSGTGAWTVHAFTGTFPSTPALFLTTQTYNGSDPIAVRARNVTNTGFQTALFEEEIKMDGHVTEEVGYLAVYSPQLSGTVNINGTDVPYLLQAQSVDHRFVPVLSSDIKLEEEQSDDTEINHTDETVSILALGDKIFTQDISSNGGDTIAIRRLAPEYGAAMEWGTVDGVDHNWMKIPLAKEYMNPVVVAKPVSFYGGDPGVIRIRNVSHNFFELRYNEWAYKDGWHTQERVFYMVVEAGERSVAGLTVEAGELNTSKLLADGWEPITFSASFSQTPSIFTSVQTYNGADPVTTRLRDCTTAGFDLTMDEEEAKNDGHTTETIGWIAIEKGTGNTADNRSVVVLSVIDSTNHIPTQINFGQSMARRFPVVVSDMITTHGGDPCFLRYQNLLPSSIDLFIQEEASLDAEMNHIVEDVSVFVAE